jgi:hypothetical protein
LAVRVGVDQVGGLAEVVVVCAGRAGDGRDQVADALDRFDVAAGLTGRDGIAGLGRGHGDHVAEGLLGEVGHSGPDQPAGTGPDPQVIGAVSQAGRDVGHGSSDQNVLRPGDGVLW